MSCSPQALSSKLSPELSELVVYCRSVSFRGFQNLSGKAANEMSSFSESEALRLIKDTGNGAPCVGSIDTTSVTPAPPLTPFGLRR